MLDLSQPAGEVLGVALAGDHQDPHLLYALPPPPRLALDAEGRPALQLLQLVEQGALVRGDLSLVTELRHSERRLAEVAELLQEERRDPLLRLRPLQVSGASASLAFVGRELTEGSEGPLVLRSYGRVAPRLDPPHTARFGLSLTPAGVRLVEAALRSGGAPLSVVYSLSVEALRTGLGVVARVDWARAYQHLSAAGRDGQLITSLDLSRLCERLRESSAIQLQVVSALGLEGAGAGDARIAAALDWVQRELVERFCEPVLLLDREAARASLDLAGELFGVGHAFAVKPLLQLERAHAELDLQSAAVCVRTLSAQAALGGLLGGSDPSAHIAAGDTGHPFFARAALHLTTAQPLSECFVKELRADWSYGSTSLGLRLDESSPEARAETWADASPDRSWELNLAATLSDAAPASAGESVSLPVLRGETRELTLDLAQLLGLRSVELVAAVDGARVALTRVRLVHLRGQEQLAEQERVLPPASPRQRAWLSGYQPGDRLQAEVAHLLRDGRRIVVGPLPVETCVFLLPPPFPGQMTVHVFSEDDWTELSRVLVELKKQEAGPSVTLEVSQPGVFLPCNLDLPDPGDRSYWYRLTRLLRDGQVEEDDWLLTDLASLLVGRSAADRLVVEPLPVGPELPIAGVRLIEVAFSYIDAENGVRSLETLPIRALADRVRWEVELKNPARRSYDYQITWHLMSGEKKSGRRLSTSERKLLVPTGPGGAG